MGGAPHAPLALSDVFGPKPYCCWLGRGQSPPHVINKGVNLVSTPQWPSRPDQDPK